MNNINQTIELLTAIALSENEEEKEALVQSLRELKGKAEHPLSMEDVVREMLTDLGIPCNLSGYDYCVFAVCALARDSKLKHTITYGLYPMVAKEFGTTGARVERTIRHAIEVSFDRCDDRVVRRYFGNTVSPFKGKPTNSEFLCALAEEVKWRGAPA